MPRQRFRKFALHGFIWDGPAASSNAAGLSYVGELPAASGWLTEEPASDHVRLHLLHLIAAHHGELQFGSPTLPRTPEAIALHHIDNLDAKLEMMKDSYAESNQLADGIYEKRFPLPANLVRPLGHHDGSPAPAPVSEEPRDTLL